jgi:hypothetical protein
MNRELPYDAVRTRREELTKLLDQAGALQSGLENLAAASPALWDLPPFQRAHTASTIVTTRLRRLVDWPAKGEAAER